MYSYTTFSALIIEPSASKRSYLWQATLSEPSFSRVKGIKSLEEAIFHLQEGNAFNVILLSNTFKRQQIASFIEKSKASSGGKEAAYVLVLPEDDQIRETIALTIKDGVDGFLFSPFSVNSLKEVANIAASVKLKFETEKRKASLLLILPDLTKALDSLSLLRLKGKDFSEKEKVFKTQANNLKEIAFDFRDLYIDLLIDECSHCKPRELPAYKGASKRVKELLDRSNKKKKTEENEPENGTLTE